MQNFDLYTPARILFGKGEEKRIGELLKPHASKVLLHYGSGSIKKSGLYDTVTASLKESGISFAELGGVKPNPRLSLVHEGIALCKKENVDLILAVGGGSTIDSAKAIAMGVYYDGDIWEFTNRENPLKRLCLWPQSLRFLRREVNPAGIPLSPMKKNSLSSVTAALLSGRCSALWIRSYFSHSPKISWQTVLRI